MDTTQTTRDPEQPFEPIVRLTAQWRRGGAWLGPAWAVVCGIIASAHAQWNGGALVTVLAAVIIAEGLWTTLWAALAETPWAAPLARWRTWTQSVPMRRLPYTQPGSAAERMAEVIGQYRHWAANDLLPNYGNALASVLVAPVAALVLSAILGAPVVVLTLLAILIPQLALALCRGNGRPSPLLRALIDITLPLMLGCVVYRPLTPEIVAAALGFGVAYAGAVSRVWDTRLWNIGQALVLLLLIALRHSVGAFAVGLLWLPQFLLQAQPVARRAQWWLMASMLITAMALG
jgi:hypothetical protein